jgi:hypothetical protein
MRQGLRKLLNSEPEEPGRGADPAVPEAAGVGAADGLLGAFEFNPCPGTGGFRKLLAEPGAGLAAGFGTLLGSFAAGA